MDARRSDWRLRCDERKRKQEEEIPSEWRIKSPPENQCSVLDVPRTCGQLNDREILITETVDIDFLLRKLACGEWTSVEVTTAFYKRAVIAHQLVRRVLIVICTELTNVAFIINV